MREPERKILVERKAALIEKAKSAGLYLKGLGAAEVYLFGSITRDDFHPHSDVDIAVSGLPYKYIYSVEARIADILGTDDFDLVYLEYAKDRIRQRILREGTKV